MDVLYELEQKDIINISKICQITNVYSKKDLIKEIDNVKVTTLSKPVKDYFIKENIVRTLDCDNQIMNSKLNDHQYLIDVVHNVKKTYKTKIMENNFFSVSKYMLYNNHHFIKFCYQHDPNMTKEWFINTYIIPFMYYCNLTFNVLIPESTGILGIKQMKSDPILSDVPNKILNPQYNADNEVFAFIITPYVEKSLIQLVYQSNTENEDYYYIFQVMYTLACFGKVGLMHNDTHCGNIRIRDVKPRYVRHVVNDRIFYDVKIDKELLFYDFDLGTVGGFIKTSLKSYNIDLEYFNNVKHRSLMSPKSDDGRRDMIIFLTRYLFVYYDRTQYLYNTKTKGNDKSKYIRQNLEFRNSKKIYNNLIDLLIFMTRNQIKKYFIGIKRLIIIPYPEEYKETSLNDINKADELWIQNLLYKGLVSEFPLSNIVTSHECMSPLEVLQSKYFKKFVGESNKIDKSYIKPITEVSINIDENYMKSEFSRFMKEYFNV